MLLSGRFLFNWCQFHFHIGSNWINLKSGQGSLDCTCAGGSACQLLCSVSRCCYMFSERFLVAHECTRACVHPGANHEDRPLQCGVSFPVLLPGSSFLDRWSSDSLRRCGTQVVSFLLVAENTVKGSRTFSSPPFH